MSLPGRVFNKIMRVIEGPPVRERIVVQRVEPLRPLGTKPGFIIGVYRSGTTLLRYILDSHRNIAVPPESNFLHPLAEIWRSQWLRMGLQGVGVDSDGLIERLREFSGGIFEDYARAKGKCRWFDKTPSYIDLLDFIDVLFGKECRYIMLYRHGLDVANSLATMARNDSGDGPARQYAHEYPHSPRLASTRYWSEQCEKMLGFEASHPDQCFHLHYEQLAIEPARCLPPLFEFLEEPWDPEVLRFAEKAHDFGLQDSDILSTKGFAPRVRTYTRWEPDEIAKAREISLATMKKLGYDI